MNVSVGFDGTYGFADVLGTADVVAEGPGVDDDAAFSRSD